MKNKLIRYIFIYFHDRSVRFNVALLAGLVANACYVIFNTILGILYANAWLLSVSAYYTLIAVLRFMLMDESGAGAAEVVSKLIVIVSIPMTGTVIYTVLTEGTRSYPRAAIPVYALYALFGIIRAVFGLLRTRGEEEAARRLQHTARLSIALISVFNLQTSLISALGVERNLASLLNFLTGGAVAISTLALAVGSERALSKAQK